MNRIEAKTPGWYRFTIDGKLVDEGEDAVPFYIAAREHGHGALVEEVRHPVHGHAPFGCYASGMGLRLLAGMS